MGNVYIYAEKLHRGVEGGVMISVPASSALDREFIPRSG